MRLLRSQAHPHAIRIIEVAVTLAECGLPGVVKGLGDDDRRHAENSLHTAVTALRRARTLIMSTDPDAVWGGPVPSIAGMAPYLAAGIVVAEEALEQVAVVSSGVGGSPVITTLTSAELDASLDGAVQEITRAVMALHWIDAGMPR